MVELERTHARYARRDPCYYSFMVLTTFFIRVSSASATRKTRLTASSDLSIISQISFGKSEPYCLLAALSSAS